LRPSLAVGLSKLVGVLGMAVQGQASGSVIGAASVDAVGQSVAGFLKRQVGQPCVDVLLRTPGGPYDPGWR
jgi:hypothetical protein